MRAPIVFGQYLLLERISVGGMAEVFKAKSFGIEGFEKIIAIKRILPAMAADAEFIEMFIDEAKIVGQLSHANICQLFELGQIGASHYIAMEFVWGKDLLQLQNRFRKQGQKMPVAMAMHVAARMCDGLDYAHKRRDQRGQPLSIVHRDVSPQNVLVSYEGEIKLIDFGIAKASTRSSRTQAGILKGKFGYMSPEQVRGMALDHRSDVFAVGTVLHELLTGKRLFLADSDFTTLERVRNAQAAPPSSERDDVPAALDRIVLKALARDRNERYQSAGELAEDLRQCAVALPMTTAELGTWMQQAFASEHTREREQLESFRALTLDNVGRADSSNESSKVERPLDFQPGEFETRPSAAPVHESAEDPDNDSSTRVDGPQVRAKDVPPPSRGRGALRQSEGPTEIFGEVDTGNHPSGDERSESHERTAFEAEWRPAPLALPRPRPRSPEASPQPGVPRRLNTGSALPLQPAGPVTDMDLPSRPLEPDDPTVEGKAAQRSPAATPTPPSSVAPRPAATPGAPVFAPSPSPLQGSVSRIPAEPPGGWNVTMALTGKVRAPLWRVLARDGGLAGGIAVLVLGLVVSGRFVFGRPVARPVEDKGVIAVASVDGAGGEVLVDGKVRGQLQGSQPLLLEGLEVGEHEVVVSRGGAGECSQRVTLDGVRPAVVNCRAAPIDDAARLVLHLEPDDVTVMVDAQEISASAAREPLLLTPSAAHTVTASRDGYVSQSFQVTLKSGELQERTIALSPRDGVGWLVLTSSPGGARVIVDGKDTGKLTPVTTTERLSLSAGRHSIVLELDGKRVEARIDIMAGEQATIDKKLP